LGCFFCSTFNPEQFPHKKAGQAQAPYRTGDHRPMFLLTINFLTFWNKFDIFFLKGINHFQE